MKKKKRILLIISILCMIMNINIVKAEEACTKEMAMQMSKIIWNEGGADSAVNSEENFYHRITIAAIILNNTNRKSGNSWYEKIHNLGGAYGGYPNYKDASFESFVYDKKKQGELLYISELVLTGKYTLPKNMVYQCAQGYILSNGGTVWDYVDNYSNFNDHYFGYTGGSLSSVDVFGNEIKSTDPSYYRKKAESFKLSDYSAYTIDTVCSGLSNSVEDEKDENNNNYQKEEIISVEPCENPDILRVIYFADIIIDMVKIMVPIALIIMGTMDFSRSIGTNDEDIQKKVIKKFAQRILCGVIIFAAPWIVEVLLSFLGNLTEGINFRECFDNANKETIERLEAELEEQQNNNINNNNNTNNQNNNNQNNNNQNSDNDYNNYNYIIYIGDSRTVGMCNSVNLNSNENCTIAKTGSGYNWLNGTEVKNNLSNILKSHSTSYIVINMGTNSNLSASTAKKYANLYNDLASNYPNSKIVAVSVTQVDYQKAKKAGMYVNISLDDNSVNNFNNNLKNNLNSNVMYCDIYSKMENYNYVTKDGVHYNSETYKFIYNEIQNCLK